MAKLEEYAYGGPEWERREHERYSEYWNRTDALFSELVEAGLKSDTLKGFVWSFGVADGSAHYIVTKLRPLTLAFIDIGDGYAVPDAHIRGLTKEDLQAAKDWELSWRNIKQ